MDCHPSLPNSDLELLLGSSNQVLPLPTASHSGNAQYLVSKASHADRPYSAYKMLMFTLLSGEGINEDKSMSYIATSESNAKHPPRVILTLFILLKIKR
jgi:hypothetical protein